MVSNPFSDGLAVEISAQTDGFQESMDGAIGSLSNFKQQIGLAGAALAALSAGALVKATQKAREWEDAMADVEKVTDPQTARELDKSLQDLGTTIPIATENLAVLAEQAGKFGAESTEEIETFVESVGKIQTATDLSAEVAGKRFAKIAGAVGMPLSEIDKLGNGVNALADSMKTDAGEITDTATRTANTLSQQFGLGEDAVLALSASMNEVSPSSRRAAGSLRRAAESLMDPNKVEDLAGALGMTTDEFRSMREENPEQLFNRVAQEMDKNGETANELRGILGKAATDFSKLGGQMEQTEQAQQKVNSQFEEGTSLQKEMEIRTNTFSGQVQLLKNQLGNLGRSIGSVVLPPLTSLLGHVSEAVSAFSKLNERTNGYAGALTLIGGVITGVVTAIGAFAGALASSATAAAAASGAVTALGTAFTVLTGPIGIAIAAIAALAAAWKMNLFGIQEKTRAVFSRVKAVISTVVKSIQTNVIQPALTAIRDLWAMHGDAILTETTATFNAILSFIRPIFQTYISIIRGFWNIVSPMWEAAFQNLVTVAQFVFDTILTLTKGWIDIFLTAFRTGMAVLRGDWGQAWDLIVGLFNRTIDRILSIARGFKSTFISVVTTAIDGVIGVFQNLYQRLVGNSIIPDMLSDIISEITSWTLVTKLKSKAESALSKFKSAFDLVGAVESAISSAQTKIENWTPDWPDLSPPSIGGGDGGDGGGGSNDLGRGDYRGMASGGLVKSDGLVKLHAGERVIPEKDIERGGVKGGTSINIGKIEASSYREGQEAAKGFTDELRSAGFRP